MKESVKQGKEAVSWRRGLPKERRVQQCQGHVIYEAEKKML